jgi:hypothetical protein
MRKKDKLYNIKKANQLAETRYILNKSLNEADNLDKIETYGQLKQIINSNMLKQKGQKIGSVALDVALGLIPGMDIAKNTFAFIKAAVSKPDNKKTNTWLDKLDIDDMTSQIVDDTIENNFMEYIAKDIDAQPDNKRIDANFNMNDVLTKWLKTNFKQRTIAGIPT